MRLPDPAVCAGCGACEKKRGGRRSRIKRWRKLTELESRFPEEESAERKIKRDAASLRCNI